MTLSLQDATADRARLMPLDHAAVSVDLYGTGTLTLPAHGATFELLRCVPVRIDVVAAADPDAALGVAEHVTGRWLDGDGRWLRPSPATRRRNLRLAAMQPDLRLVFRPHGAERATVWLLAVDRGALGWASWTHAEWDRKGEAPGAWQRDPAGVWRLDGATTPGGASGLLEVEEFAPRARA